MQVLMIVAPKDFRDEEFLEPKEVFAKAGAEVTISSKGVEEATGKFGAKTRIDKDLSEVNIQDYDAVVFVGGPGTAVYFEDPLALKAAKEAFAAKKVIGAICIAPSILANAGILSGKQATAFSSEEENLRSKGASYTGEPVTRDKNIITANGPAAATKFGEEIIGTLRKVNISR